jgi:hypothetical protein
MIYPEISALGRVSGSKEGMAHQVDWLRSIPASWRQGKYFGESVKAIQARHQAT